MRQRRLQGRQISLRREHFNRHPGRLNLLQDLGGPHLLRADQHIRPEAQDALCRQLTLIADAGQGFK